MKNEILNCPNCGAVRTGVKCEYCGEKMFEDGATPYMKKQKEGAARK